MTKGAGMTIRDRLRGLQPSTVALASLCLLVMTSTYSQGRSRGELEERVTVLEGGA